jgi:outer membrane receptor for ferrienterochelin and colicin
MLARLAKIVCSLVAGSCIRRRDTTAPSPITTLGRDDLAFGPQPTLEQALNRMPQLTPDFGRTSNNPGDGTSRLNLRGMGSERTLVLLNSRRRKLHHQGRLSGHHARDELWGGGTRKCDPFCSVSKRPVVRPLSRSIASTRPSSSQVT